VVKYILYIAAISPVALFSLRIGTEERRRLAAGRQGRLKRPNINLLPIIFFSFSLLTKQRTLKILFIKIPPNAQDDRS